MLDVLYIGAAVVTVGGVLLWPVRALIRRRAQRRRGAADRRAELQRTVAEFTGVALSAHGRVATLGRLRGSWFPVSEHTAVRLGEPLLEETAPIAELRSRIRFLGNEETNRAADEVLHVLEESAALLREGKLVLRRVDWSAREAGIGQAVGVLDDIARRE